MSVKMIPFQREHLSIFKLQEKQSSIESMFTDASYVDVLCEYFQSLFIDGQIVAIGGLVPDTHDVAQASILLQSELKHKFIHVHRNVKRFFNNSKYRRIYMRCHVDFDESIVWAKALGFDFEGIEVEYIEGHDFARFAWLRNK